MIKDRKPIALIPARSGSKRIPNKNIRMLGGNPLIGYAIAAAIRSGVFSRVVVSTDSPEIAGIAESFGAAVPFLRPEEYAGDSSPDIEWVRYTLTRLSDSASLPEYFFLLRPTNPFRQPETIQRAWEAIRGDSRADTLRAVEKCREHPYKMWRIEDGLLKPLFNNPDKNATPWHSTPYQALPEIYVQNASLEIAPIKAPLEHGRITGESILPFLTRDYEGFDLNYYEDWIVAEHHVANGVARLPKLS